MPYGDNEQQQGEALRKAPGAKKRKDEASGRRHKRAKRAITPGAKQRRAKPAGVVSERSERLAVAVVCKGRTYRLARFAVAQAVATRAKRKARPEQAQQPQTTNKNPAPEQTQQPQTKKNLTPILQGARLCLFPRQLSYFLIVNFSKISHF